MKKLVYKVFKIYFLTFITSVMKATIWAVRCVSFSIVWVTERMSGQYKISANYFQRFSSITSRRRKPMRTHKATNSVSPKMATEKEVGSRLFIPGRPFLGRPGFPPIFIPEFPGMKPAWFPEKTGTRFPQILCKWNAKQHCNCKAWPRLVLLVASSHSCSFSVFHCM